MSRHFLGSTASVCEARRFVTAFLNGWPIVEAAELIVSELATNAVRHSASGRFGGRFLVTIHVGRDRLWLAVLDEGGPRTPEVLLDGQEDEGGRGLLLVSTLADSWGVDGDEQGRTVWALLSTEPAAAVQAASCR
ncbi:ATP-binding protein [Planomonospora sp. ID91781]|uniref:ATP-binding protein n=1 Tax=Planomonospora sp. ID91781 TaxID=2738135 RepID=UPI0018C35604|nr:ATP-binding protein [Planomonospora sp. ID91781]MBG0820093.1 ATP-binding protein [Planomonospora sp. ID91781]